MRNGVIEVLFPSKLVWYPSIWLFFVAEFCEKFDDPWLSDNECPEKEISALDSEQFDERVRVLSFSEVSILPADAAVLIKEPSFFLSLLESGLLISFFFFLSWLAVKVDLYALVIEYDDSFFFAFFAQISLQLPCETFHNNFNTCTYS